jgi:hypothetical protein
MKMSEEAKKLRREAQNEWRKKNKDKVKIYNVEYWEKKAAEAKAKEGGK